MERISRPFNGKNYWRKKGYNLLDGAALPRRTTQVVQIKGDGGKPRRLWRLKRAPKLGYSYLKKMVRSPKKLWLKFKEGYINMMLRLAGDMGHINGGGLFEKKRISQARKVPLKYKNMEEFEARLVLEIYKSLSTSKGLSEVA